MKKPLQADVATHLDISVRALRERYAAGQIDKNADLDTQRKQYLRLLREQAANRAPSGPLDPAQERARLDRARADAAEMKLAQERKELVRVEDYERAMASAFKTVGQVLEALPDVLERDCGINAAAVERCVRAIDSIRDELHARLVAATQ